MAFQKRKLFGIDKLIQSILQASLPSGFVGWFDRTTAPDGWVVCNGQTYTDSTGTTRTAPNLIGRYPLGATSDIGGLVEAGLPNITGTFGGNRYYNASGAFAYTGSTHVRGSSRSGGAMEGVNFNASRSSSVYGKSTTVTPPSCKLLPCIKK